MSKKSKTPVIAYPYEMADIELKALTLEAFDSSSHRLEHYAHDWNKSSGDGIQRVDLREKYENYNEEEDDLYSDIDKLEISLTFDVNTKECLQKSGRFIVGIHLKSSMSRIEKYKVLDSEPRTEKAEERTVILTLEKTEVQQMRGNIIVSPIAVLESDVLGTKPVRDGNKVFATSNRSILSKLESTNQYTIVFDDPGPPTSSGMELKWQDMSGHEGALYALSYTEIETSEDPIHVCLVLNKESHLYNLSKIPKSGPSRSKKALKDLALNQIVCDVQVNLLSDFVRFFGEEMQQCLDGTKKSEPNSALEFAMDVLQTISEKTNFSSEEILKILNSNREEIDKITLKLQHARNLKGMLNKMYTYMT